MGSTKSGIFFKSYMVSVEKKSLKRNLVLPISLIVLLLLFIGSDVLYFYLPKYMESKVLPRFAQMAGIKNLECDVRRIGFTGLDLGGLCIGDEKDASISIESVRLNYSITGLLRKHIDSVVIAGVELNGEFSDGEFIIPGLDWQSFFEEQTQEKKVTETSEDNLYIPITIGSLKISNAVFVCAYNGQSYRIPFDLLVRMGRIREGQWDKLECILRLYPRGEELTLSSNIFLPDKKALLKFHFGSFHIGRFEDIISVPPGLIISGDIEAACFFQSSQWAVESAGRFFITLEQSNSNQYYPLQVLETLNTAGEFSARFTQTGEWEFKLSNDLPAEKSATVVEDYKIRFKTMDIISRFPIVSISGKGTESKGKVEYATKLYDFNLVQENATIKVPSISLTGNAYLDNNFTEGTADFELKISDADVSSTYLTTSAPELSLIGDVHYLKDGSVRMNATANLENTEISSVKYNTRITGINGSIPFQWPCENLGESGNFSIEAINWNNLKLGTVSGTLCQSGLGVVFEGSHNSNLLPELTLNFKGDTGYSAEEDFKTECTFSIPRFNSNSVNLGEFIPNAEGMLFSGELELDGNLNVDAEGNIKCSINTTAQNSRLELIEQGIIIEGINFPLSMPDFFSLQSAPNQQFHFKKASFGEITFSDGKVGLQIESPETIFVENCEFKWCNGHVYTHALRVQLYETDYDITMYCNNLELSKILDQFSIAKAEGSGAVNGRIPIKFAKGKLFINNGFLYSTPGKDGIIRIAGTDVFDTGIPQNTPQYSQLDFTKEALKELNYNWVTLSLNTEEEDLILLMSLYGKPGKPLPFTYDRSLGTFVRIQAESKEGINYPIHLDINFKLPVNEILYYGQRVKGIINLSK